MLCALLLQHEQRALDLVPIEALVTLPYLVVSSLARSAKFCSKSCMLMIGNFSSSAILKAM